MTLRRIRRERRRRAAPRRAESGSTAAAGSAAPRGEATVIWIGKAALLAFGAALAMLWSTSALADDSLERALSLTTAERYREARDAVDRVTRRTTPASQEQFTPRRNSLRVDNQRCPCRGRGLRLCVLNTACRHRRRRCYIGIAAAASNNGGDDA